MTPQQNRKLMEAAFEGLARGDNTAFAASMSDDFSWTIPAGTPWAGTYVGRKAVRELFQPFYAMFAETQMLDAISFTAEDDRVFVELRGRPVRLRKGGTYQNEYCYACRFEDGRLVSVREYLDTARMNECLDPPPWSGTQLSPPAAEG